MAVNVKKTTKVQNKFALRLMPSVRLGAERISKSEGVSLNQFFNVAIAEKVARLEHQRWVASRKPLTNDERNEAIDLLLRGGNEKPDVGDEIPPEYVALMKSVKARKRA